MPGRSELLSSGAGRPPVSAVVGDPPVECGPDVAPRPRAWKALPRGSPVLRRRRTARLEPISMSRRLTAGDRSCPPARARGRHGDPAQIGGSAARCIGDLGRVVKVRCRFRRYRASLLRPPPTLRGDEVTDDIGNLRRAGQPLPLASLGTGPVSTDSPGMAPLRDSVLLGLRLLGRSRVFAVRAVTPIDGPARRYRDLRGS
jgi:hypothetical protein